MLADDDLGAATRATTPCRLFRPSAARARFAALDRLREALSTPRLRLLAGYSIKTNPRAELMRMAREFGFFAEAISPQELAWAREHGFAASATIFNGPHPLDPHALGGERTAFAFADSLEGFARNDRLGVANVAGVRLRPSMLASRFGVPVEDDAGLAAAAEAGTAQTLGISFHARREDFHGAAWRDVADDVLARAVALERASGRPVVAFDVGGGWTPEEFDAAFAPDVGAFAAAVAERLPSCTTLIVEPGQAICTPAEALLATVLEVRERRGRREAIVDAGYPEWPLMHAYVHAISVLRQGRWLSLGRGPDTLGGRTCLEYDLVDGLRFPADLAPGDRILIGGTGSYDSSMTFPFARGGGQESAVRSC